MNKRGLFLSLDGIDGTGKSTQCRMLADWLRSKHRTVTECADPGGTNIGKQIRTMLLDRTQHMSLTCEMFLFMASRAQLTEEVILPSLETGQDVVCDRYLLANVVYQGHAGGLDAEQIWSIGKHATYGLSPDLTVVLDLPIDLAQTRLKGEADRMESRQMDYHLRVREGFLLEAKRNPDGIQVVDASGSVEEVHEEICRIVANTV